MSREVELLNALAQAPGGVQVNITAKGATVSLGCVSPGSRGKTLQEATLQAGRRALQHPLLPGEVREALELIFRTSRCDFR